MPHYEALETTAGLLITMSPIFSLSTPPRTELTMQTITAAGSSERHRTDAYKLQLSSWKSVLYAISDGMERSA